MDGSQVKFYYNFSFYKLRDNFVSNPKIANFNFLFSTNKSKLDLRKRYFRSLIWNDFEAGLYIIHVSCSERREVYIRYSYYVKLKSWSFAWVYNI